MTVTERAIHELICAVLQQAVDDWKALQYGEFRETMFCGDVIKRFELVQFFQSEDFDKMAGFCGINPAAARKALKIPAKGELAWWS